MNELGWRRSAPHPRQSGDGSHVAATCFSVPFWLRSTPATLSLHPYRLARHASTAATRRLRLRQSWSMASLHRHHPRTPSSSQVRQRPIAPDVGVSASAETASSEIAVAKTATAGIAITSTTWFSTTTSAYAFACGVLAASTST